MANASQFIGSKISLISKSEIRYEGILYSLDVLEATISLAKVKSFGTEDRPTERPVPPKDEIYEFIIFRGSDIKGIDVVEPPKAPPASAPDNFPNDPAIVEVSHYHSTSRSSSGFGNSAAGTSGNNYGSGFGGSSTGANKPSESVLPMPTNQALDDSGDIQIPQYESPSNAQNETSRSNNSTPAFGSRKSPSVETGTQASGRRERGARQNGPQNQQRYQPARGRGGQGMSRGGGRSNEDNYQPRGRGSYDNRPQRGGNYQHQQRGGGNNYARDYHRGPPRTQGILKAPATAKVTFDAPFDFEKANEELLTAIKDLKLTEENKEKNENAESNEVKAEVPEEQENKEPTTYYKKDNFFDSISCEALESNRQGRPDWRAERKLNAETFGLSNQPRRGGGYYNRNYGRGGYGYGYGYNNRGGYRGGRGGGYGGYNNRRGGGGGGGGGSRGSF